jgi:hypothetical protein
MKFIILLFCFFIISALILISNNNLALIEDDNLKSFASLYVVWVDQVYENLQTITGHATKMNWVPS